MQQPEVQTAPAAGALSWMHTAPQQAAGSMSWMQPEVHSPQPVGMVPQPAGEMQLPGFNIQPGFAALQQQALAAHLGGGGAVASRAVPESLKPQEDKTLALLSGYLHQQTGNPAVQVHLTQQQLMAKQQQELLLLQQQHFERQQAAEEAEVQKKEQDAFEAEQLRRAVEQNEGYFQPQQPLGYIMQNEDLRYTIIGKEALGVGVFSVVWPCADANNKLVAMKVVRYQDHFRRYANKEVLVMQRCAELTENDPEGSAQIGQMRDHFVHRVGEVEHLCMAFEKLEANLRQAGKQPLNKVLKFGKQILSGLRYLHDIVGLVHCDVKPDNLLLRWDGLSVKLCDFGTCRSSPELQPIDELQPLFYRAPEVFLGVVRGRKIDMWSAGCTIYEMAVGRILFRACNTHREVVEKIQRIGGPIPAAWRQQGRLARAYFSSRGFHPEVGQPVDPDTTYKKTPMLNELLASVDFGKENARAASDLAKAQLAQLIGGMTVIGAATKKKGGPSEGEKKVKQLAELVERLMEIDPAGRLSAAEACQLDVLKEVELPPPAELQEAPPLPEEAPPPLPPSAPPPKVP